MLYVKVPQESSDFIIEATGPVEYGTSVAEAGPGFKVEAWESEDGKTGGQRLTIPGDVDWRGVTDVAYKTLYLLEFNALYDPAASHFVFRYAYWQADDGITMVVTTAPIYILSESGRTIDRVR